MLESLLLLAVACRQEETISILEKGLYLQPAKRCQEAEKLLQTDPAEAVKLLDPIVADAKVAKRECTLKIEEHRNFYKKYEFYPYQLRGRAWMKLAEQASPEEARKLMRDAVDDLTTSFVKYGLASSRPYLDEAKRKLADSGGDPEPAFVRKWDDLVSKKHFVSARRHLESDGGFLPEEERKKRLGTLRKLSDDCVRHSIVDFLEGLERDSATLDMPPKGEMLETNPRFDWCADFADTVRRRNEGTDVLDRLFDHAVAAIRLERRDENRWFAAAEAVAYDELGRTFRGLRDTDEAAAGALDERWRAFEMRVIDAAGPTVARNLSPLLERFRSTSALRSAQEMIRTSPEDPEPERRLEEAEASLSKIAGTHLRAALTYRLIARILRAFLAGRTEAEVARDLGWLATDLRQAGGAVEMHGFGPKVEAIFRRLR